MLCNNIIAQSPGELFGLARSAQDKGDFIQSEQFLLSILQQKDSIKKENLVAVYNQLGLINKSLGKLDKALGYYFMGEDITLKNVSNMQYKLPSIYNNIGDIFKDKGDYSKALEYFQESRNNLNAKGLSKNEKNTIEAHDFNSIGLIYFQQQNYTEAIEYFEKSIAIRKKYQIEGLDIVYSNYANCLRDLNKTGPAETYYQKCIDFRINTYGKAYYKLSSVYTSLGKLRVKKGAYAEALNLYEKAIKLALLNYGEKHPYVAEIYEVIGDYYLELKNDNKALVYYQKSLIANADDFNNASVYENPGLKNILSEIQLLQSFKKKTKALMFVYKAQDDNIEKKQVADLCIKTVELAINVIKNLRKEYVSAESKLYITQNEKTFYMLGIENATQLYKLTSNRQYLEKAYQFSRESKAAVLEDEINSKEVLAGILPDNLNLQKTEIQQNIAALKKLILDEREKIKSDQQKISRWQTELFKLNKEYERLLKNIKDNYPHYSQLASNQNLFTLQAIQEKLQPNETLVEYSYSLNDTAGQLHSFLITENDIKYYGFEIDSTFERDIEFCHNKMNQAGYSPAKLEEYNETNQKLYTLYKQLIKPLKLAPGKNIIIVPDEKIAYISFDELISEYKEESEINYANLPYLLYNYRFAYAYSANLFFRQNRARQYSNEVYAFAPDYNSKNESVSRHLFGELKNAKKEINSIFRIFGGTTFVGNDATKANFESSLKNNGIYHLALHANADKEKPEYSYLVFSASSENNQEAYLYNYEIASISMNASLLVLSACNTGDGDIYSGEGVMSLSRWFLLAGIQSVVHGLWKINDESSALIMDKFYKYLAEGKSKSEALQLAKIDYIENSSPELANPKYWAGMVVMGNQQPLVKNRSWLFFLLTGVLLVALVRIGFMVYKRVLKMV